MLRTKFSNAKNFIHHPSKIAIAIVKDEQDKPNSITLEWFMRTSIDPPMFAISIGHTRYSYQCLQENRVFNLCFPSIEMREMTLLSGSKSGRDIDKLEYSHEPKFKGRFSQLPVLSRSVAVFECKVITQVKSGDHTIYVGEVKYSWINENAKLLLASDL